MQAKASYSRSKAKEAGGDEVWLLWLQCFVVPAIGEGKLF